MHGSRLVAAMAVAAVVLGACSGRIDVEVAAGALPPSVAEPPAAAPPPEGRTIVDPSGVQDVLDVLAAAFREGDPAALEPHLFDPESSFGRRWLDRATWMAELPLARYQLRLDDSLPDMATEALRNRFSGPVQVLYVVEELQLEGFDEVPAAEDLFLTLVDDGDGWQVVGDRDGEPLGLVSVDHLWDHGPVSVTVDEPVMAIHHPDGPDVGPLLTEARAAMTLARERWPLAWPERVPVIVPRDQDELGELLHVTFDLSNFVAFATSTSSGERGEWMLGGSRIVINPDRFLQRTSEIRQRILVHELIHVASRPAAGPLQPSWLDEGIAQAIGERQSTTGTVLLDALATGDVALPTDGEFTVGGRDRIFLSYQLAWSFVDHLVARFGADRVAEYYLASGQQATGEAGTEAHHLDAAAREVFGAPLDELVADWRAAR